MPQPSACPSLRRPVGPRALLLVVAWAALVPSSATATAGSASRRRTEVVQAIRKVMPSVVSISSEKKAASNSRWPFSPEEGQRPRVSGMGTGVIIDARGYILTNQHVVDKVQGIEVRLHDNTTLAAQVVQQDVAMDLAVLKVETGRPLTPISIGTSSDLMLGEEVITIGNAFGYENTVSRGIISQIGRNVTLSDDQVYRNLIQTDACINPGNSGGPLINIDGELIGICVAVRAGAQGIGFALPIDDVKRVAADLLSTRRLAGTWHGMITGDVVNDQGRSLIVRDVAVGSPAETAGIRPGDQLVKVGDLGVENALDVERALLDARPGRKSAVVLRRGGEEKSLALEVQRMPRGNPAGPDAGEQVWRTLGLKTVAVTPEYVTRVNANLRGGLYIQAISPGSPADLANLQKGDILVGMNVGDRHWETIRPDNILYILRQSEAAGAGTIQYYIVRRNTIQQGALSLAEVASAARR